MVKHVENINKKKKEEKHCWQGQKKEQKNSTMPAKYALRNITGQFLFLKHTFIKF